MGERPSGPEITARAGIQPPRGLLSTWPARGPKATSASRNLPTRNVESQRKDREGQSGLSVDFPPRKSAFNDASLLPEQAFNPPGVPGSAPPGRSGPADRRPNWTSCRGPNPSRRKTVAARSSGEQASRQGAVPRSSVAPKTAPPGMPPPARSTAIDRAQWSRPAAALTRGVRPNSPPQSTTVSPSRPRDVQVADQRRERLVQGRQEAVAQGAEVVGVRVPAAEAERHEPRPGLDQPPGGQRTLAQRRPAVAVAQRVRLARQVERGADAVGVEDLHGLAVEAVEPGHQVRASRAPAGRGRSGPAARRGPPGRASANPGGSDTPCAWSVPRAGSPSTSNGPNAGPR